MNDPRETLRRLVTLALHEGTSAEERNAAALGACRIVRKHGFDGDVAPSSFSSVEGVPVARPPRREDVPGPNGLVTVGEPRYCRECILRPKKRGERRKATAQIIAAGETARKNEDGSYTHLFCR